MNASIDRAIGRLGSGAYAIGVSGGADSVALLHALCRGRVDLTLRAVHLNHETRGSESEDDERFVQQLVEKLGVNLIARRIGEMGPRRDWPANRSARFRAARHALFQEVVEREELLGVILAHHADDQAETVMLRLLRGAEGIHVGGMRERAAVGGLTIFRPLLEVSRKELREYLREQGQDWREDASNESEAYQRNRVRKALEGREELSDALIGLHQATSGVRRWIDSLDALPKEVALRRLAAMGEFVGGELARRWLAGQGVPRGEITPEVVRRLMEMALDAATPARREFPGCVMVRRTAGRLLANGSGGGRGV